MGRGWSVSSSMSAIEPSRSSSCDGGGLPIPGLGQNVCDGRCRRVFVIGRRWRVLGGCRSCQPSTIAVSLECRRSPLAQRRSWWQAANVWRSLFAMERPRSLLAEKRFSWPVAANVWWSLFAVECRRSPSVERQG
jgi:hypothetical protein